MSHGIEPEHRTKVLLLLLGIVVFLYFVVGVPQL